MVEDEIKVGGLQQPSAQPCTEGERLLIIHSEGGGVRRQCENALTLACTHRWSHGCVGCANHSAAPRTCCSQGEAKNKAQRHADAVEMVFRDTGDLLLPSTLNLLAASHFVVILISWI
jgi:hypothetical protein